MISKSTQLFYQILFILCAAVTYINVYELTFVVWGLALLLTVQAKYSLDILKITGCFLAILLIAFIVSLFEDHRLYHIIRDITYLLKPVMGLLIGYQLCKDKIKKPLLLAVNAGVFIAVAHLGLLVFSFVFSGVRNLHDLRRLAGYYSDYEIYALIILIFQQRFSLGLPQKRVKLYIAIVAVSCFFYFARTNFIQFIILLLAVKGYFVLNTRSITVIGGLVMACLVGYAAVYASNPRRGATGFEAFLYKIKNAPIEPFKTKVDSDDWKDFNDNYRSYENILTTRQMFGDGAGTVIFGKGLGSSVDLKREVWLQSSYMRYIPFLHNGYMTIFLKSGLVGVIILIFSIAFFFRFGWSDVPAIQNVNNILLGTGFFLIISYWVFLGFYFVPDSKSVFVGCLLAYRERIIRSLYAI